MAYIKHELYICVVIIMSSQTEKFFADYISRYLSGNKTARIIKSALDDSGVCLMPLVDH